MVSKNNFANSIELLNVAANAYCLAQIKIVGIDMNRRELTINSRNSKLLSDNLDKLCTVACLNLPASRRWNWQYAEDTANNRVYYKDALDGDWFDQYCKLEKIAGRDFPASMHSFIYAQHRVSAGASKDKNKTPVNYS